MERNDAFTALLMRHSKMLWRMCWYRVDGDEERCKDMLQEVYLLLWERFDGLRPDASPTQERAWVRWQVRSVFYRVGRRRSLDVSTLTDHLADTMPDEETARCSETLDELLSTLNGDERKVIQLYLEGYQGDEIGKRMGVSRDAVYQRMHRIILKLRRVALLLLVLASASAVALAVFPQWRHRLFHGDNSELTRTDTLECPVSDKVVDTLPLPQSKPPSADTLVKRVGVEPLEFMPSLNLLAPDGAVEEMPRRAAFDHVTLYLDGYRLTIVGADGELVRIYQGSNQHGNLVFSQIAGPVCEVNLFPDLNTLFARSRNCFVIYIGDREPYQIVL